MLDRAIESIETNESVDVLLQGLYESVGDGVANGLDEAAELAEVNETVEANESVDDPLEGTYWLIVARLL